MTVIHAGLSFIQKYNNEIRITKNEDGFLVSYPNGENVSVSYFSVVMIDLKYPNEIISKILGKSTDERVHISEDAYALIMKACEVNRIFF